MKRIIFSVSLGLACVSVAGVAPAQNRVQSISASDKRAGAEAHPQLVQQFGGAMKGPAADYVARVGKRIAVQSGLSGSERDFTITLLDSPVNNAFAMPGGYVYVTRGLLGLMNDEAELASVLGHEIGHVAARHGAKRQQTATITSVLAGVVGAVAGNSGWGGLIGKGADVGADLITKGYSRNQEYQADDLGVRYLSRAGYDPLASADMLLLLDRQQMFEARARGGSSNNLPSWASTHPNSTDRVSRARGKAQATGVAGRGQRNRDALLSAVDGLVWGDDPAKGFVDGREFKLPSERLAFTVPEGFQVNNADDAVTIVGSGGQAVFSGDRLSSGLDDYIGQAFAKLSPNIGYGQIRGGQANGLSFRYALGSANSNAGPVDVGVFAYRPDNGDTAYKIVTISRAGTGAGSFVSLVESMRRMSAAEGTGLKPLRIKLLRVKAGETPQTFARMMAFPDNPLERFLLLNGLERDAALRPGDRVKVVVK